MKQFISIPIFVFLITFMSCATFKAKYAEDYIYKPENRIQSDPIHELYLIGDAGNAPKDKTTAVFKYLNTQLKGESLESTVVWLGDNIYPVGLAPEDHPDYALGKHRIEKQLEVHDNYKGRIFFIPGNHDWYEYGAEGVRRQEKVIEDYLAKRKYHNPEIQDNYFIPDNACGDILKIDVNEDLGLILMDSNWFLTEVENNTPCSFAPDQFLDKLKETIQSNPNQSLVICLHHPPYTFGPHGGYYTFRDYTFPLTQLKKNLWIPLPFSGIVVNKMRNYITEQDAKHASNKLLSETIAENVPKGKNHFIVSGHEHTLQFIKKDNLHYIVSGAGSKNNAVGLGKDGLFAVGKKGYVKMSIFSSGSVYIEFIVPDENGLEAEVVFDYSINLN